MHEKRWRSYAMTVNGLPQKIRYNADTVEGLFLPLLRRLTEMQRKAGCRILVFLAAPPATGKSTLLQFLEELTRIHAVLTPAQALGMDGFHYLNSYLAAHTILRDGAEIPLKNIKGAPETFDVALLAEKLRAAKKGVTAFPVYDRRIHDPRLDALTVDAPILLVEGNWLLLDEEPWCNLHALADYTLRIDVSPELLRDRLIARKVQGGLSVKDARAFYERSDAPNVLRFAAHAGAADEVWRMEADGDFVRG
ncbi:nucleoside/nucleotide kinase family protein [Selenomonas timonae]|uniref:Nucleoside/nucleotide kinase family protein n=1 Tax=Selenomonas timonae TaxID=2754044 RepID=A0A7G7VLH8_9FIRM|nr:nucleoside/nucleotide kinase family protein [Selenomonas timonae]QNH54971.1 nucleoside/nucleotide kinase family protein [Selenomonas timonae]